MGCLFARMLHEAGCPITLLLREAAGTSEGVVLVEDADGTTRVPVILENTCETSPVDFLLVTTKAPQVVEAVASMAHRLHANSHVVIAANGMGYLDAAHEAAGAAQLYCCTTTEGAYRIEPLHIRHAGSGVTLIGQPGGGPAPDWLDDWLAAPLDCRWEDDIESALWHKLAINCAINPLTATERCVNGELATRPELREMVDALCEEIARVSRAAGFAKTAETLRGEAFRVIGKTADNRSSMLQDVLAERPTEIDYITGHLLRVAAAMQLEAPKNEVLYRKLFR